MLSDKTSAERNRRYRRRQRENLSPVQVEISKPSLVALHENGLDDILSDVADAAISMVTRVLNRRSAREEPK